MSDKIYKDPETGHWTIEVENPNGPNARFSVCSATGFLSREEAEPMLLEWKENYEPS